MSKKESFGEYADRSIAQAMGVLGSIIALVIGTVFFGGPGFILAALAIAGIIYVKKSGKLD